MGRRPPSARRAAAWPWLIALLRVSAATAIARSPQPPRSALLATHDEATVEAIIERFRRAQQEVAATWKYDPALVCRSAGLHGPVEKLSNLQGIETALRFANPTRDALAPSGVPIFARGQVYVSHKFKFIYLRQPKASSTTVVGALHAHFCPTHPCDADHLVVESGSVPPEIWRDYFVFTVVRNPIARMQSTYLMFKGLLRRRLPNSLDPGPPCSLPFSEFAREPRLLHDICESEGCCAFVHKMSTGRSVIDDWLEFFTLPHLNQQSHLLFDAEGRSAVDFIGRTERLDEDWPLILASIDRRARNKPMDFTLPSLNAHATRDNVSTPAEVENSHPCLSPDVAAMGLLNESTVYDLSMRFALDMRMLQFV